MHLLNCKTVLQNIKNHIKIRVYKALRRIINSFRKKLKKQTPLFIELIIKIKMEVKNNNDINRDIQKQKKQKKRLLK
jgi:hypothetical protein